MIRVVLGQNCHEERTDIKSLLSSSHDIVVVGEARSETETEELVGRLRPDVVLVAIPSASGVNTMRFALKPNTENVIILSPDDNGHDVCELLADGARGYCLRDNDPERLCSAIRCVASGGIWIDGRIAAKFRQALPAPCAGEDDLEQSTATLAASHGEALANHN